MNWQSFLLTFIPLFIVFDAFGNVAFVMALSEGMSRRERSHMINIAVITAGLVGLVFLFFGQFILRVMDIDVGEFAIAGGLILLVLSLKYIITGQLVEGALKREEMVAVVPIGTPLLSGPATITTLLLLASQYPLYVVLISFVLNVIIAWVLFVASNRIVSFMGRGGVRAVSNVFNLILAAIAVSMIIRGLNLIEVIKLPG